MFAVFPIDGLSAISIVGADMGFWEGFYFACFIAGLLLSVISLVGGMGHINWHFHGFHLPHATHVPHGASGSNGSDSGNVPWWNAFSIMVFLCWFGAAGYLMTRYGTLVAGMVFLLAALCGLIGGALVFFFLAKVLMPHEKELTADETAVPGAVGTVSAVIRAGGTGEILYEQMGARRSAPARADKGEPISHGEEIFVVRYEHGIAYVRRWEELHEMQK
jgi:membrane protein implicated in regulation of membrane protease activity